MKKVMKRISLLATVLMLVLATACGNNAGGTSGAPAEATPGTAATDGATTATGDPIKIGFFAPITAPAAAADGQSIQQSVILAAEIANGNGGINGRPVEMVMYDDGLDTTQAISIAEKLTTRDKVVAVVSGSYSAPTRVAAPIFQEAGIVMVSSYAQHPEIVSAGDYIFAQSFQGQVQGKAGATFAVNELGLKKIAIISVDLDYGTELSESFKATAESLGAEIVSYDKITISDNDLAPVITKLKGLGIDGIYMANYYSHAAEVMNQCAIQGLDVPVLATQGADSWQFLLTAGENANGMYLTTNMDRDSKNAATQEYIQRYKEKYNMDVDMVGASAYDACQVLFAAIAEVGTDSAAIQQYIANMQNFESVTGTLYRYTDNGTAIRAIQVQRIKDGEYHYYGVIDDEAIITPE